MISAKEKAIELFNKYEKETRIFKINGFEYDGRKAKNCALIAVYEVLLANHIWYKDSIPYKYWNDVKNEIQKL